MFWQQVMYSPMPRQPVWLAECSFRNYKIHICDCSFTYVQVKDGTELYYSAINNFGMNDFQPENLKLLGDNSAVFSIGAAKRVFGSNVPFVCPLREALG